MSEEITLKIVRSENCDLCQTNPQTPDSCPLCVPECPRFGIGREEYDKTCAAVWNQPAPHRRLIEELK